jgi:hypothetical protein
MLGFNLKQQTEQQASLVFEKFNELTYPSSEQHVGQNSQK